MTLRWAVIGCGDIAEKRVAPAINRESRSCLHAVVRRDEAKCRDFAARHGATHALNSFAAAVALDEVDAVYIATPVYLHAAQTMASALAGKHVLVEKPMALTADECAEMTDACRTHGVTLGVAYYRRFYPKVRAMQDLIAAGDLGEPQFVRAFTGGRYRINRGEQGSWRTIPEQGGGGPLQDIGSHRIDLMLALFGPIRRVKAEIGNATLDAPVEDHAHLLFEFANGMKGALHCTWNLGVGRDEWEVYGTEGGASTRDLNGPELVIERGGDREVRSLPADANLHFPLIEDFVEAALSGRDPEIPGEQGRETTRVIEAAYLSAREGKAVEISV